MIGKKVLVALGGNAILRHRETGTAEEQLGHIRETSKHLVDIVDEGHRIAITHGNGPQVGDILVQQEVAKDALPPMPLDICGAETQGMIGYMLQRSLDQELTERGELVAVVTILTQVHVDKDDPAFGNPTKFIGPYYTAFQAHRLAEEKGWSVAEDSGKGYRRVVPSPEPQRILEADSIKRLFDAGAIVIACGGGGVPVTHDETGTLVGVEAVVDKDHSAAVMGRVVGADVLLILTDVDAAAINYGKRTEEHLAELSVAEAGEYLEAGEFPQGSMGPKVESAVRFVEAGGELSIITSLERAKEALDGRAGTRICA